MEWRTSRNLSTHRYCVNLWYLDMPCESKQDCSNISAQVSCLEHPKYESHFCKLAWNETSTEASIEVTTIKPAESEESIIVGCRVHVDCPSGHECVVKADMPPYDGFCEKKAGDKAEERIFRGLKSGNTHKAAILYCSQDTDCPFGYDCNDQSKCVLTDWKHYVVETQSLREPYCSSDQDCKYPHLTCLKGSDNYEVYGWLKPFQAWIIDVTFINSDLSRN